VSKEEGAELLSIEGCEVRVTHPAKLYFSKQTTVSKLDLVSYYLSVAPGALLGIQDRPIVLKRFVNGAEGEAFYQKRAPTERPLWLRTVTLSFPSGRTAEELVVDNAAGLAWIVNLGCIELHPHPVRSGDLDHPDELRVDLDPGPGVNWTDVRLVALEVKAFLEEMGLRGWPKTSGSRGMHVNVRIQPRWTFAEVRRAAVALSRAVERRVPALASSKWWKEERHGVFLDYNQNAKDRTTASAYSVRPLPDARVSTPLHWHEVPDCEPADFTILTVPRRLQERGDPHAGMDSRTGSLEQLLELADKDEAAGLADAPWPPHFRKMEGEGPRVMPSRAKSTAKTKPKAPRSRMPLLVVANSPDRNAALAGLDRWKSKYPEASALLAIDDILVDSMRGRSSTWTRIRVNLRHVPEVMRPPQETPDPDDDPTREWRERRKKGSGHYSAPSGEDRS
jgi:bifunctional non-homologous end joining protein LigD